MSVSPIDKSDKWRLLSLLLFLFLLYACNIGSFYHLQIIEGEKWSKEAQRQHYFVITEPSKRGLFFSNNAIKKNHPEEPQKLVIDIQKFHLHIDPDSLPLIHKHKIAAQLIDILQLPSGEHKAFSANFDKKSRSRKLAMWLDKNKKEEILAWWTPFAKQHGIVHNGLFFVADYKRSYPFGKLLGPLLHTVRDYKDEQTQLAIPTGGLELYFDSYLKGKIGKRRLMRSPRHSLETGEVIDPPLNGADVYLTINTYLQAIAEEELEKGVKKCGAKGGRVVMIDPYTGEILALAQYPFFYPPDYQTYFNDSTLLEHTHVKAITEALEPGSVIKPFTLCAALKANKILKHKNKLPLFDPSAKIATSNSHFVGRSKPLVDTHPHSYMNMSMALQKSANIYLARLTEQIIERLGAHWYRNFICETFCFGTKSGIEFPYENSGMFPSIGKRYRNNTLEWSASTPYSLAIGYNLQANSIQLVRAYSVLANGGFLITPTLVRSILKKDHSGKVTVLVDNTTSKRVKRVLEPDIVKQVVTAMKYTTKSGGTAPTGDVRGYTEAGKSSTSKKLANGAYADNLYRSSFIGFTPVDHPAFVMLVTMDEPDYGYLPGIGKTHHGGINAAPVFREISQRALAYLGITPDDPHGYPVGDPRYDPQKADWLPEVRSLQQVYKEWNNK